MERSRAVFLKEWLSAKDKDRKPLVIRGARQVGKTWLVRNFAEEQKKQLIEINFERRPQYESLFKANDPRQILLNLTATLGKSIEPHESLLFLDEIQVAPQVLSKLRWFAEELPELPVITAGSLLEFTLAEHSFSMPVGRIGYLHIEPLSFEEFLLAMGKKNSVDYLSNYHIENEIPIAIHEDLMTSFKEYLIVGGMPAAVASWSQKKSFREIDQIHYNLMATYRDDFAKYSGRLATERLDEVMHFVPKRLGEKFVYSKVNSSVQSSVIKQALDLLFKARVCHRVIGCAANGVPLAAETMERYFKALFLDVGLSSTVLGLSLDQLNSIEELTLINKGGVAEQVVGQILRTIVPGYVEPSLYYWHREEKGSSEIDYVIQYGNRVIPIEVKAGTTGSLKSLHFFMGLKQSSFAVRINSDLPSLTDVQVKDNESKVIHYKLLSLPFYLLGQLHRLIGIASSGES